MEDGSEGRRRRRLPTRGSRRPPFNSTSSAVEAGTDSLIGALPQPSSAHDGEAFVDWQNDVTVKDLLLATREGFRSIEHVKRYTTTGMATDQGKTSNLNALGVVAESPRARPVRRGRADHLPHALYAGDLRRPGGTVARRSVRAGADHRRSTTGRSDQGAVFEDVGAWKRARYFPTGAEDMARRRRPGMRRRCERPAGSSTPRRWARSSWSVPMRRSS